MSKVVRRSSPDDAAAFRAIGLASLLSGPNAFAAHIDEDVDEPPSVFAERIVAGQVFGCFVDAGLPRNQGSFGPRGRQFAPHGRALETSTPEPIVAPGVLGFAYWMSLPPKHAQRPGMD